MILVDTCGWVEWLADGALADTFQPYLEDAEALVIPVIVQFELYKWLERNCGEEAGHEGHRPHHAFAGGGPRHLDRPLLRRQSSVASTAALSVADAVIYASARKHKVDLVTSDDHFEGLPGVVYLPETRGVIRVWRCASCAIK
jgi:predicted nucleic acid-binding protein